MVEYTSINFNIEDYNKADDNSFLQLLIYLNKEMKDNYHILAYQFDSVKKDMHQSSRSDFRSNLKLIKDYQKSIEKHISYVEKFINKKEEAFKNIDSDYKEYIIIFQHLDSQLREIAYGVENIVNLSNYRFKELAQILGHNYKSNSTDILGIRQGIDKEIETLKNELENEWPNKYDFKVLKNILTKVLDYIDDTLIPLRNKIYDLPESDYKEITELYEEFLNNLTYVKSLPEKEESNS